MPTKRKPRRATPRKSAARPLAVPVTGVACGCDFPFCIPDDTDDLGDVAFLRVIEEHVAQKNCALPPGRLLRLAGMAGWPLERPPLPPSGHFKGEGLSEGDLATMLSEARARSSGSGFGRTPCELKRAGIAAPSY